MKEENLISIIIPVYNRESLIGDTLDSILAQSWPNWECIVVDDGSEDNTLEVLEAYCKKDARISYHQRPENRPKGANACRNYGFELSKGAYINWFDSDDLMHPQKLELQLKALKESEFPFCVCQTMMFDESMKKELGLRHPRLISDNFWEDYIMFKILWVTPSPLWKRSFLQDLDSLFDEELQAAQEWEFHVRSLSRLKEYSTINRPLNYIRIHKNSVSTVDHEKKIWHYFLARYKVYELFKKECSPRIGSFLRRYLLEAYKNALRNGQITLAGKMWVTYISREKSISFKKKLRLSAALISFKIFKKGNSFISYVNEI